MNLSQLKKNHKKTIKWLEWSIAVLTTITAILVLIAQSGILETP